MNDTWQGFASSTTLHGLHYIVETAGVRRICWMICLLATFGGFIYVAQDSIKYFVSLPVNTIISTEVPNGMEFPDLTICNLNTISKGKAEVGYDNPMLKKLNLNLKACDVIRNSCGNLTCGQALACMYYPLLQYSMPNCNETMKSELIQALSNSSRDASRVFNPEEFMYYYGYDFSKMLTDYCMFKSSFDLTKKCTAEDFDTVITQKGLCHTFNITKFNNRTGGKSSIIRMAGVEYGLSVILNVCLEDYLVGDLSAGIRVIVGERGLGIDPYRGLLVKPGSHARVVLAPTKYERLEAPYESNCSEKYLPGYPIYSKDACVFDCKTKHIISSCGCRPVGGLGYPNVPVCSLDDENCTTNVEDDIEIKRCYCNSPCQEVKYKLGTSTAAFPTTAAYELLTNGIKLNQSRESIRENFIFLQVGFSEIEYTVVKVQCAYGVSALLGDIGGNMGLLLGCSVLTLAEFVDIIFMILYKRNKIREPKNMDVNTADQSKRSTEEKSLELGNFT